MKKVFLSKNFDNLRRRNAIYVDKTERIYEILESYERVFFARPRRFGKSLTIDIIQILFENGVDPLLQGTWIHDHWNEPTYPVLKISFLDCLSDNFEEFTARFCERIRVFADRQHLSVTYPADNNPASYMNAVFDAMKPGGQLVILIDEYDCMLTGSLADEEAYERYTSCLHQFYGTLKDKTQIRFLGITGVTRLKNVSIFSVGSDIQDITYKHLAADLMGYTREEIRENFADPIAVVIKKLYGVDILRPDLDAQLKDRYIDALLDRLADEYDGYCFDENYQTKVYSTWSVNNFFLENVRNEQVRFGDYWYDNGGVPSILSEYLNGNDLDVSSYAGAESITSPASNFLNPTSLLTINPAVLMCQTGYLTIRSVLADHNDLQLGIPNREVRKALSSLVCLKYLGRQPDLDDEQLKALEQGDPAEIIEVFNRILASVPYDHYPITDEASVRSHLQLYLQGARVSVKVEKHNSKGRSDLELEFMRRRVICEFKYVCGGKAALKALDEAVSQLKSRGYGNDLPYRQEIVRIAAVFDGTPDKRRITEYRLL